MGSKYKNNKGIKSFTLVELLIVIAILAVLAAAVVVVLNPAELLAQARDSQRVTDMKTMKDAIDLFILDNPSASLGTAQRVYISLPDTASNCPNLTATLPVLPTGWQYVCVTSTNLRNTNGTGWIPLNFGNVVGGSPIPYLPIDPSNDAASGRYYTYTMGGSYELTALMEAQKENASVGDGGSLTGVYEVGTDLSLVPPTRDKGLIGYWTFNEGSGSTANDSSVKKYSGTWAGTGSRYVIGRVGSYAAVLNGTDDTISVPDSGTYNDHRSYTMAVFVKTIAVAPNDDIGDRIFTIKRAGGSTRMTVGFLAGKAALGWDGTIQRLSTDELYNDGAWHHLAATYDGSTMKLYIDGILKKTGSASLSVPTGEDTPFIGSFDGSQGQFDGSLDDFRLYSRALSSNEIKAIYDNSK